MIDYLFCWPDEVTAHAVLDRLGFGRPASQVDGVTMPAGWDDSRVLPVRVIVGEEPIGADPETGAALTRPVYAAGFWLAVSVAAPRDDLYAIPACMREADREKAERHEPYVVRERFTAEQLARPWRLDRQWCGVDYSHTPAE